MCLIRKSLFHLKIMLVLILIAIAIHACSYSAAKNKDTQSDNSSNEMSAKKKKAILAVFRQAAESESWPGKKRMRKLAKEKLAKDYEKLKTIHRLMGKPGPGDWLDERRENGRSVQDYKRSKPIRPGKQYKTIYIQPIGSFTSKQRKVVRLTAQFIGLYYDTPVKIKKKLPLTVIPKKARRKQFGTEQLLTTYILYNVLAPNRPKDAVAFIALTANDLWPGKGWNFVFGQASLIRRVGVWSIHRNGDPDESKKMFRLCLMRALKTSTHELGHILSIKHCIAYQCNMNGSNHRLESDTKPVSLCPFCLYKLCWNVKTKPVKRFKKLARFLDKQGFQKQADFYRLSIKTMKE